MDRFCAKLTFIWGQSLSLTIIINSTFRCLYHLLCWGGLWMYIPWQQVRSLEESLTGVQYSGTWPVYLITMFTVCSANADKFGSPVNTTRWCFFSHIGIKMLDKQLLFLLETMIDCIDNLPTGLSKVNIHIFEENWAMVQPLDFTTIVKFKDFSPLVRTWLSACKFQWLHYHSLSPATFSYLYAHAEKRRLIKPQTLLNFIQQQCIYI